MPLDLDPHRPATKWADLQSTFHRFDHERFKWLAAYLRDSGRHGPADLAEKWADEHLRVARQLEKGR
jgi:hypothetical protein